MINESQMTTEEAIDLEKQITPRVTDELKELLEDIDLYEKELDSIRSFHGEKS